jgi:ATP phosphoribosyltransferase regulatory subunit
MVAESAARFEALEDQATQIMSVFARRGYERVAPSVIQPADVFLDRIGEEIRSRTYVFSDPEGTELCLRPDLTIPACRLYLERNPAANCEARYAYNGPAFRYQRKPDASNPREFRQAGIESFGVTDRERAETEVLELILEALRVAGLRDGFRLHFGDLGLFYALMAALPIPKRWRERLVHNLWRPDSFHAVLHQLAAPPLPLPDESVAKFALQLDASDCEKAEQQVAEFLAASGIVFLGTRSLGEIADRLIAAAADMREPPLSGDVVRLVEAYLDISGKPDETLNAIARLSQEADINLSEPIERCAHRYTLLRAADIDIDGAHFSATFGRQFEYYSGFVFQIDLPERGPAGQIAGGGRYDGLLASIGAPQDAPAVGSAIHTEHLLAAVRGDIL